MEFDSPEKLRTVLMAAATASLEEFTKDLERRIAIVLYHKLPQATVVNMAQTISREVGAYVETNILASGVLERSMDKLL